jgi:AcrR family transcriptional regulator
MAGTTTQRRPRGSLTREQIIKEALALLEEHGPGALSMRRLADRLGVAPNALYTHVRGKADLIDGLIDQVYAGLTIQPDPAGDWAEQLAALSQEIRAYLLAHPAVVPYALQQPGLGPHSLRLGEAIYNVLRPAGFSSHLRRWHWDQVEAAGQPSLRQLVEVPVAAAPSGGWVDGRGGLGGGRRRRTRALVSRGVGGDQARLGAGGGRACPLRDQAGQAGVRSAGGWQRREAEEEVAARGGGSSRAAAALGLGRPRWVVVVEGDARVGGPGEACGRAGRGGRAAPARPRLARGVPGSRLAAL